MKKETYIMFLSSFRTEHVTHSLTNVSKTCQQCVMPPSAFKQGLICLCQFSVERSNKLITKFCNLDIVFLVSVCQLIFLVEEGIPVTLSVQFCLLQVDISLTFVMSNFSVEKLDLCFPLFHFVFRYIQLFLDWFDDSLQIGFVGSVSVGLHFCCFVSILARLDTLCLCLMEILKITHFNFFSKQLVFLEFDHHGLFDITQLRYFL